MSFEGKYVPPHLRNKAPASTTNLNGVKQLDPELSKNSEQNFSVYHSDLTVDALASSFEALSVTEDVPTATPEIPSWLSSRYPECYFNWTVSLSKFGTEEARILGERLSGRFLNVSEDVILKELEHLPFEAIYCMLTNAFCHLYLRDFEVAMALLMDVKEIICVALKKAYILPEHGLGFTYLFQGLLAYQRFLELGLIQEDENDPIGKSDFSNFDLLPLKASVVVKGTKAMFYVSHWHDLDEQLKLLQQICKEDPEYDREWKLTMNLILRRVRKSERRYSPTSPSGKERAILTECLHKEPENLVVKFAVAHYLGELVRSRKWDPKQGPLVLTNEFEFKSEDEVHEFLHTISRQVLETFAYSKKFNLDLAELLTMTTPRSLQDLKTGKRCLQTALDINPTGSKENHRMGLFLFVHDRNFEEGLKYTRRAYDLQKINFPALMDALQLMMRDVDEYKSEIEDLFKLELKGQGSQGKWDNVQRGTLHTLYGIYCFMSGNREQIIDALVTSYNFKQESLWDLKNIPRQTIRYNWNSEKIRLAHFQDFLFSKLDDPSNQDKAGRKECLQLAISALAQGMESESKGSLNKIHHYYSGRSGREDQGTFRNRNGLNEYHSSTNRRGRWDRGSRDGDKIHAPEGNWR